VVFYDKPNREDELGDGAEAEGEHREGQEEGQVAASAAEAAERTGQVFGNVRDDGAGLTPGSKPKEVKEEL